MWWPGSTGGRKYGLWEGRSCRDRQPNFEQRSTEPGARHKGIAAMTQGHETAVLNIGGVIGTIAARTQGMYLDCRFIEGPGPMKAYYIQIVGQNFVF